MPEQELLNAINDLDGWLRNKLSKGVKQGPMPAPFFGTNVTIDPKDIETLTKPVGEGVYHFQLVMNKYSLGFYPRFHLLCDDQEKTKHYFDRLIIGQNKDDDETEGEHEDNIAQYLVSLFEGNDDCLEGPNMDTIYKIVNMIQKSGDSITDEVNFHFMKSNYGFDIPFDQLHFLSRESLATKIHEHLQDKTVRTVIGEMPAYDHLVESLKEKLLLLV